MNLELRFISGVYFRGKKISITLSLLCLSNETDKIAQSCQCQIQCESSNINQNDISNFFPS